LDPGCATRDYFNTCTGCDVGYVGNSYPAIINPPNWGALSSTNSGLLPAPVLFICYRSNDPNCIAGSGNGVCTVCNNNGLVITTN